MRINFKVLYRLGEVQRSTTAIDAWANHWCAADIDLTKFVPQLDSIATDIVTQQRDALLSRKDLAQKTKDFRKLDDVAKLGEFKGLLKGMADGHANIIEPTDLL